MRKLNRFILEKSYNDIEISMVREKLDKNSYMYDYSLIDKADIPSYAKRNTDIPVGSIQFVEKYLNIKENPIELPSYLRTDEFLKRDYEFVTWDKVPRRGMFFFKDVTNLKAFSKVVNAEFEVYDELWNYERKNEFDNTLVLDKNATYLVSSIFPILSEYRVYVFQGEIDTISLYNGDATILPDMDLIKKAVSLINNNEEYLDSYTIDVMVGKEGTALIEVHNFTSCGLYSTLWGSNLLAAYKDGINYLRKDNHELQI